MKKFTMTIIACLLTFLAGCSSEQKSDADQDAFEERRQAFIEETAGSDSNGVYTQLVRLYNGMTLDSTAEDAVLAGELQKMVNREDCADFKLPGLLNILYKYGDSGQISDTFKNNIKTTVLGFKFWPDELEDWAWDYPNSDPNDASIDSLSILMLSQGDATQQAQAAAMQELFDGVDAMNDACYWSENHYILYSSGAYLAAQLYPDETFTASGETGTVRMAKFKTRVMKWLELRYKSGFSEWLSNVYYNEDIPPTWPSIHPMKMQTG